MNVSERGKNAGIFITEPANPNQPQWNPKEKLKGTLKGVKYSLRKKDENEKGKRNIRFDPHAIEIKRGVQEQWRDFSARQQYSATGRLLYQSPTDFEIDYYDPRDIPKDSISVVIVGKRRTGKTVLTKDLIWNWSDRFDEIYVFTKTAINEWYQEWIPKCYVYEGYDSDVAESIWQRAKYKTYLYKHGKGPERGKGARICVICDDLLSDKSHRHDETLEALYTAGRHVGITVIYITQKFKGVVPAIRDNTDLVFSFNMFNKNEARQLAEEFLGNLNLRTAMEIQDMYANQDYHTCLAIETWRNKMDPEEYLKFYQAEEDIPLKVGDLGSQEYLNAAAEHIAIRELEEERVRKDDEREYRQKEHLVQHLI